jgi:hypothetical protein
MTKVQRDYSNEVKARNRRIMFLHRSKYTDKQIGHRLGMSPAKVRLIIENETKKKGG